MSFKNKLLDINTYFPRATFRARRPAVSAAASEVINVKRKNAMEQLRHGLSNQI